MVIHWEGDDVEPPEQAALLAGRYRLQELIGRGGMGAVWAADDEVLGREVAVKEVVAPPGMDTAQQQMLHERTLREARAAARLTSRSVVTIFDVVEVDERPWIVMEKVDAPSLSEVLDRRGRLPVEEVVGIGLSVLDALRAAHESGVLHRDVKPANIMVLSNGRAVLTDFGIAVSEGDSSLTTTGMLVGSPAYMAPERALGNAATPASDLWSLGAAMYAAVQGVPPFDREGQLPTLHAVINEDTPPANHAGPLRPVLSALLAKEPEERPGHARLRDMLGSLPATVVATASGEADGSSPSPVLPGRSPIRTAASAWRGRRPAAIVLVPVLLVAGLAFAGGGYLLFQKLQPASPTPNSGKVPESAAAGESAPANADEQPRPSSGDAGNSTSPDGRTGDLDRPLPNGYRLYRDPTGFTVAVPAGWRVQREGTRVDIVDPDGSGFFRIGQTNDPKPDPLADWQRQEESVAQRLPDYRRLRLERVDYRGWKAADWEFTWRSDSGRTHVLNRNVVTGPNQAYALYWSMPEKSWQENLDSFRIAARSFQPAR